MLSLCESLQELEHIFEASGFMYTVNKKDALADVANEIAGWKKEDYIEAVLDMAPKYTKKDKETFEKIVRDATDIWFDKFNQEMEYIPFCFDAKGFCKIRMTIASQLFPKLSHGDKVGSFRPALIIGDGSISLGPKITTEDQEKATVICWNRMMSAAEGEFDIKSDKDIENLIKSVGITLTPAWIRSCSLQCQSIWNFLKSEGCDPKQYKATRYGDGQDGPFGRKYADFVEAYMKLAEQAKWDEEYNGRISKDNYDPSDIILYKDSSDLTQCMAALQKGWQEAHDTYRKVFLNHDIMGISLKKVSGSGKAEKFNVGSDFKVNIRSVEDISYTPKRAFKEEERTGCKVLCNGPFKFDGTTNLEDSKNFEDATTNKLTMELRSFGAPGMDVKGDHGPSLGKVPVRFWTSKIGLDPKKQSLAEMATEFGKFASDNENISTLEYLIQEGIKYGPWCLPFILIH